MANQYAVPVRRFGETTRPDVWWIQPLAVFLGLASFLAYSTWAMFQPLAYAEYGPYLSPMFSPPIAEATTDWMSATCKPYRPAAIRSGVISM